MIVTSNIEKRRIFIGHGGSQLWRALKDFIVDEGFSYEEFNRCPVAGLTAKERLEQMLDSCVFAILIHTAEDETAGGEIQARLNVVHETGLFQGRLGFDHAVILRQEGCSEFSNLHGVQELRFTGDDISARFNDVRRLLSSRI